MTPVNWEVFGQLPGSASDNFEALCRSIIWSRYSKHGEFRALANQPGVEFHLRLTSACELGKPGRWFGWQCRWYGFTSMQDIRKASRNKIEEAIAKTERELPELTDWVLWTRFMLTKKDQEWFYSLFESSKLKPHLWATEDLETQLTGPALLFRGTFFGDLVLTPDVLRSRHEECTERVRDKWIPDVHCAEEGELRTRRMLLAPAAWPEFREIGERISCMLPAVVQETDNLPVLLTDDLQEFLSEAEKWLVIATEIDALLNDGKYDAVQQLLEGIAAPQYVCRAFVRRLRSARHRSVLSCTNMLADMYASYQACVELQDAVAKSAVAVIAEAGCGKTQFSAELTAETSNRPAGVLLFGADLRSGDTLDTLASVFPVHGKPVSSFDALVAAVDSAGKRAGKRLPIVVDGLNESEDPRVWKSLLARLNKSLRNYSHVLVLFTLRPNFTDETLPENFEQLQLEGFEHVIDEVSDKYFEYYKIDETDAEIDWHLLKHPLTLRIFL